MRDDRVPRALLRLYPRAWRARYGDEFLALVEDQGLSWRGVVDVVAAAGVERARAIVAALRTLDTPPSAPLEPVTTFREWIAPKAALLAFAGVVVLALGTIGVPYPQRGTAVNFALQLLLLDLSLEGRLVDRFPRSFYGFAAAALATGLGWLTAFAVTGIGAPTPSERVAFVAIGVVVAWAAVRFLYRGLQPVYRQFRRPGEAVEVRPVSTFEVRVWSTLVCTFVVTMAMMDPEGHTYWAMTFIVWIFVRLRVFRRAQVVKA